MIWILASDWLIPGEAAQWVSVVISKHHHNGVLYLHDVVIGATDQILIFTEKLGKTCQIVSIQRLHSGVNLLQ